DEAAEHLVLLRQRADLLQRVDLGHRTGQVQRRLRTDRCGNDGVGHRLQRFMADGREHGGDFGVVGADVALDEGVVVLEVAKRGRLLGHGGRHVVEGRPSVLLPESLEALAGRGRCPCRRRFLPLRRRFSTGEPVSPECVHAAVVGPERLRAFAPSAAASGRGPAGRFSHRVLPLQYSLRGVVGTAEAGTIGRCSPPGFPTIAAWPCCWAAWPCSARSRSTPSSRPSRRSAPTWAPTSWPCSRPSACTWWPTP